MRLAAGGDWIRTIGSPSRKKRIPFGNRNRHGGDKSPSRSGSLSSAYRGFDQCAGRTRWKRREKRPNLKQVSFHAKGNPLPITA